MQRGDRAAGRRQRGWPPHGVDPCGRRVPAASRSIAWRRRCATGRQAIRPAGPYIAGRQAGRRMLPPNCAGFDAPGQPRRTGVPKERGPLRHALAKSGVLLAAAPTRSAASAKDRRPHEGVRARRPSRRAGTRERMRAADGRRPGRPGRPPRRTAPFPPPSPSPADACGMVACRRQGGLAARPGPRSRPRRLWLIACFAPAGRPAGRGRQGCFSLGRPGARGPLRTSPPSTRPTLRTAL